MFTAESQRGHARYTRDLLSAMAAAGAGRGIAVELVTSRDLAGPYRTSAYPIHPILPSLVERARFRTTLGWGASRVAHYVRRERAFLRWVESQTDLDVVHTQEYTPWLAPRQFRWLRRRGLAVVSTVHNIANYGHSSRSYMRASQALLAVGVAVVLGADRPHRGVAFGALRRARAGPPADPRDPARGLGGARHRRQAGRAAAAGRAGAAALLRGAAGEQGAARAAPGE